MEQYTNAEQQQVLAQTSPQPSSYAPSYATNSPMIASSPVTSHRATSRDREQVAYQQQVVAGPYDQSVAAGAQGNYGYVAAPSPAAPMQYAAGYATYVIHVLRQRKTTADEKAVDKTHIPRALTAWVTHKCPAAIYPLRPAATDHIMP